jgi:hypothetical protein
MGSSHFISLLTGQILQLVVFCGGQNKWEGKKKKKKRLD